MAELKIAVNCSSMLISTQFFRFSKGVEHFYYTMLLTSEPYLAAGAGSWRQWLKIGFHIAARKPPPTADSDRLLVDTRPGRNFEVKASSSNRAALEKLRNLVAEVDRVRKATGGADDQSKLRALLADSKIDALLLRPLKDSLTRNSLGAEGVDAFQAMINRGLLALCDRQITSIECTLN